MTRVAFFILVAGCALAPASASAIQIIDEFATKISVIADAPAPVTVIASGLAPGAIGGAREIGAFKTFGPSPESVGGQIDPLDSDDLRVSVDAARGRVNILWDGEADGVLNPGGLGGLDFLIYDRLELFSTFSDIGGPVTFEFYSSAGDIARTTLAVPAGIPEDSSVLLQKDLIASNFTIIGATTFQQILGDVGAMVMSVDAREAEQQGWNSAFEVVRLAGHEALGAEVPLPAPAALLLLGLGSLSALRLRRKAA